MTSGELIYLAIKLGAYHLFYRKKSFRWACLTFLVWTSITAAMVGIIIGHLDFNALNESYKSYSWIGWVVSLIIMVMAFMAYKWGDGKPELKTQPDTSEKVKPGNKVKMWLAFSTGVLLCGSGMVFAVSHLFWGWPIEFLKGEMNYVFIFLFTGYSLGCPLIYFSSRINGSVNPNQIRWAALTIFIIGGFDQPLIISMLLLYANPHSPELSFPVDAAISLIALLPLSALILFVSKDYQAEPMVIKHNSRKGSDDKQGPPPSMPSTNQTFT